MNDFESLKTFPVLGGIELQYTTPYGVQLAAVVFDDGAIDITAGESATLTLPPGATSVLRDLILRVIPLPQGTDDDIASLAAQVLAAGPPIDPTP